MSKTFKKKIILVGPGILPIPVSGKNGWGGIENILTWIIEEFDKRNQKYVLINDKDNYINKIKTELEKEDSIVHVHYDDYAHEIKNQISCPLISTSHSPYHPFIQLWKDLVGFHFYKLLNSVDSYFGQSDISNQCALQFNKNIKTGLCRCGIPDYLYKPYRVKKGNGRSLVIGKIESRKNQSFLQKNFGKDLNIDFVGHIEDPNFHAGDYGKTRYLGTWSRKEVFEKMPQYSTLILLSSFEGDVVVVKEAIAAGCSLLLSSSAALNIDDDLPFIKIYKKNEDIENIVNDVEKLNTNNEFEKTNILNYFNKKFEISKTVDEYIESLEKIYG
jgi:hypothetical protein